MLLWILNPFASKSQTIIQMTEEMGIYKIPCKINGVKVNLIFDTGAAAVTISQNFVETLIANGSISESDFLGDAKSMMADGRIVDHSNIIIREIKIGDQTLSNIPAVVMKQQKSPLLLGQSAIKRLGNITIAGDKLYIWKQNDDITTLNKDYSSSQERWDALSYRYTNFSYNFGWDLPDIVEWKRSVGIEKHTVFRADGGAISVHVSVRALTYETDIWSKFNELSASLKEQDIDIEKKTGIRIYERVTNKCILLGQHAIKSSYKAYLKDDRHREAIKSYGEHYMILHNNFLLLPSIEIPLEAYDSYTNDCKEIISEIFKGFRLSVSH